MTHEKHPSVCALNGMGDVTGRKGNKEIPIAHTIRVLQSPRERATRRLHAR